MKLYDIQNHDDYKKLLKTLLHGGVEDHVGNTFAFFNHDPIVMLEYFEIDAQDVNIWDEDGNPTWDTDKEDLPEYYWDEFITQHLKDISMNFPFMVSVYADIGTCLDNIDYRSFYELYPERP